MNKPIAKIIRGPHLLFIGANGHKTYGIDVENLDPESVKSGHSATWGINDCTIMKANGLELQEKFGLTIEEVTKLKDDILRMVEEQK